MQTVTYSIPNISCAHCVHTITMELSDLEGVHSVEVSLEKKSATIAFDAPASEKTIINLLKEINYPPSLA
ncbi:MAG: heavy-metal-associated domain-containing protein [Anaerolineales bacterium]